MFKIQNGLLKINSFKVLINIYYNVDRPDRMKLDCFQEAN